MTIDEMKTAAQAAREVARGAREGAERAFSAEERRDLMTVSENELLRATIWDAAVEVCERVERVERKIDCPECHEC